MVKGTRLTKKEWKEIIEWFLLERSGLWVTERLGLGKNQTYQALRKVRQVITVDVPGIFEGIVEVDETYLGGQKKNKRKAQLKKDKQVFGKESKRGFGTTKQPVFGILCRNGRVFAKLVDNTEAKDLIPIITKKVKSGTRIYSDTWRAYTGLATKGYVHRTVEHQKKEYTQGKNHINETCCEIIVFYTRIKTNFSKNRLNWPFNILKQKIGILGIKLTFLPKV